MTPAQSVLIAKTALDFFLKSTVIPAAQAKKEAEAVMAASKEKPLVPEPEATDGLAAIQARSATACGAVGTVEEFRANRHAGLAKRTEKAQKKAAAKRKREEDEIARRTKACHEGAKIEALLVGGKELRQLTVADLRTLILGRGGTVPTPTQLGHSVKKKDLLAAAAALTAAPAAAVAAASSASVATDAPPVSDDTASQTRAHGTHESTCPLLGWSVLPPPSVGPATTLPRNALPSGGAATRRG